MSNEWKRGHRKLILRAKWMELAHRELIAKPYVRKLGGGGGELVLSDG